MECQLASRLENTEDRSLKLEDRTPPFLSFFLSFFQMDASIGRTGRIEPPTKTEKKPPVPCTASIVRLHRARLNLVGPQPGSQGRRPGNRSAQRLWHLVDYGSDVYYAYVYLYMYYTIYL